MARDPPGRSSRREFPTPAERRALFNERQKRKTERKTARRTARTAYKKYLRAGKAYRKAQAASKQAQRGR